MVGVWPFGQEREQFLTLVTANQDRLFRFVLKQVGNRADAEELTQDVFLEAHRSFKSFRGQSQPSTWLFGIAVNVVRTFLRRTPERRYTYLSDEVLEAMPMGGDGPLASLEGRRKLEALNAALFRLPVDWREVVICVAMEGLSYEETASVLDVPVGTVRSRLSRARDRLKDEMGKKEAGNHG